MLNVRRFAGVALLLVALGTASRTSDQGDASGTDAPPDFRRELRPAALTLRGSVAAMAPAPRTDVVRLEPPYEAEDGLTIVASAGRVRLAGLDGPARNAVCLDREEKMWACGLQARAALVNLIRGQALTCRRTGLDTGGVPAVACSVAGRDVAQALVREGFARPSGPPGQLGPSLDLAMAETRGLWEGGWSLRDGVWSIRP